MSQDAKIVVSKEAVFQALQMLRKKIQTEFSDWKDADDWLFSELDFTREDLERIYSGHSEMIYCGSAIEGNKLRSGIVSRIDTLGRIQIAKALRSECGIEEGAPLEEIPTEDGILLTPYKPIKP